ncbi:hypothetical protein EYF80_044523 [Liparis tanakae]|uniref:Uncharacterized protein n=1 Tax=Liparis tanakae TaxID=230148 RepID=A0A4Z2FWZ9_9TELE|nr:hypothetical protein EYF80_044523 [Liparis tanakae]
MSSLLAPSLAALTADMARGRPGGQPAIHKSPPRLLGGVIFRSRLWCACGVLLETVLPVGASILRLELDLRTRFMLLRARLDRL